MNMTTVSAHSLQYDIFFRSLELPRECSRDGEHVRQQPVGSYQGHGRLRQVSDGPGHCHS